MEKINTTTVAEATWDLQDSVFEGLVCEVKDRISNLEMTTCGQGCKCCGGSGRKSILLRKIGKRL